MWEMNEAELLKWLEAYTGPKFHAVFCDPPYHLTSITERFGKEGSAPAKGGVYNRSAGGFMGQKWDGGDLAFRKETWEAIKNVLYPGAFCFAFAGTRGFPRMACAIEDAGFINHPDIAWIFGSGFPKATRIDSQIDKRPGATGKMLEIKKFLEKAIRKCGKTQEVINKDCGFTAASYARWRPTARPDPWRTTLPMWDQWEKMKTVIGFDDTYDDAIREAEREVVGTGKSGIATAFGDGQWSGKGAEEFDKTAPASERSKMWEGYRYGLQALKPAMEHICVFQKPYDKKPVDCIVETGAGALNIDGGRIGNSEYISPHTAPGFTSDKGWNDNNMKALGNETRVGRWPANVALCHTPDCKRVGTKEVKTETHHPDQTTDKVRDNVYRGGLEGGRDNPDIQFKEETVDDWECVDGCPVRALNAQSGILTIGAMKAEVQRGKMGRNGVYGSSDGSGEGRVVEANSGGASRFFFNGDWNLETEEKLFETPPFRYCPKASRSEREAGLEQFPANEVAQEYGLERSIDNREGRAQDQRTSSPVANRHPTVKPISLNRWLATLLLPPPKYAPRRLFVPFAGVGSEMIGAILAGWDEVIGVEMMPEYVKIGRARLEHWSKGTVPKPTTPRKVVADSPAKPATTHETEKKRARTLDEFGER